MLYLGKRSFKYQLQSLIKLRVKEEYMFSVFLTTIMSKLPVEISMV
jgi:hypothetical protein